MYPSSTKFNFLGCKSNWCLKLTALPYMSGLTFSGLEQSRLSITIYKASWLYFLSQYMGMFQYNLRNGKINTKKTNKLKSDILNNLKSLHIMIFADICSLHRECATYSKSCISP